MKHYSQYHTKEHNRTLENVGFLKLDSVVNRHFADYVGFVVDMNICITVVDNINSKLYMSYAIDVMCLDIHFLHSIYRETSVSMNLLCLYFSLDCCSSFWSIRNSLDCSSHVKYIVNMRI